MNQVVKAFGVWVAVMLLAPVPGFAREGLRDAPSRRGADAGASAFGEKPGSRPAEHASGTSLADLGSAEVEMLEQRCLEEINRQRKLEGLSPLALDDELHALARNHSKRMAEEGFFSHLDPEGRTVEQRAREAGIRWKTLGENIAYSLGYINPVAVSVYGWMESPGHRRNILDPEYTLTGVGAWVDNRGTVFFTEVFLSR